MKGVKTGERAGARATGGYVSDQCRHGGLDRGCTGHLRKTRVLVIEGATRITGSFNPRWSPGCAELGGAAPGFDNTYFE